MENIVTSSGTWDLSALLTNTEDPRIDEIIEATEKLISDFVAKYYGKIKLENNSPSFVFELLRQMEDILQPLGELMQFAILETSVNQQNKEAIALLAHVQKNSSKFRRELAFVDLELGELLTKVSQTFIESSELTSYRHYLEKISRSHKHKLSETEEKLIIEKDQFGVMEWQKLQGNWLSTRKFTLKISGKDQEVSWSMGYGNFSSTERESRLQAIKNMLGGLGKDKELYAFALRSICNNHVSESEKRKYSSPLEHSLHQNDITEGMLMKMFSAIEKNVDLIQEFILLNAKINGTEKLRGEDFEAPPISGQSSSIDWDKAQKIVLQCYTEFDEDIGSFVKDMYSRNRIDSLSRESKRAGAFCSYFFREQSAFIFQSFNNNIDSVGTLAHEMGHAIHGHLASTVQNYLSFHSTMVLAETASEFGRMLFIEKYLEQSQNENDKKNLLFQSVQDLMRVIYEVGSRFRFEESLYKSIKDDEFLSPDKIDSLYWEARNKYYGDTIDWHPEQAYHWCWKPHYYMPKFRFYNYPYVFAELIVLGLYNKYREEGESFVPKYKEFLKAGGSESPEAIAKKIGLDLNSEEFWLSGIREIRRLFEELKKYY
ncbi:MAG: Oligoendopeptidase F, plasmid [Candidatus Heimdallarchaeota archaeon LC_3]|nr:MAG: Oligoendopeptidase F, plasmid [Candidatus Heimdallarchaeota archaeon LC_3]